MLHLVSEHNPFCYPLYSRPNSPKHLSLIMSRCSCRSVCMRLYACWCVFMHWTVPPSLLSQWLFVTLSTVSRSYFDLRFPLTFLFYHPGATVFLTKSLPYRLCNGRLRALYAKPGCSCTVITSKQNMLSCAQTIYTSTPRASSRLCFQRTSFCDYCLRVCVSLFIHACVCMCVCV